MATNYHVNVKTASSLASQTPDSTPEVGSDRRGSDDTVETQDFGEQAWWEINTPTETASIGSFEMIPSRRQSEDVARYWIKSFTGYDSIPFPALPKGSRQTTTSGIFENELLRPIMSDINRHITPTTLLRAAWALIAGSMTTSDDVVFGATVYGENGPVEDIAKIPTHMPTYAIVPIRIHLSHRQQCCDYLESVQRQTTEMMPFQHVGLDWVSKLSSECRQACKFRTLLNIHPRHATACDETLNREQDYDGGKGSSPYGLIITARLDDPKSIKIVAHFDSLAIEPWLVRLLLKRLEVVMNQLASADQLCLSDIDMMTLDDNKKLVSWNQSVPEAIERCVHNMIEERVDTQPNAQAICAWDGNFTYVELDELATQLAGRLIVDYNVRKNIIVPLCFEKSKWTLVAILGVMKAGAAFVLLDPSLPEERLKGMVDQVKGSLVLCNDSSQAISGRLSLPVLVVNQDTFSKEDFEKVPELSVTSCPSDTIYVLFTSGSTGKPKATIISHRSAASALTHQPEKFGFSNDTRLYDFSSYAFDASIFCALNMLITGGCLCIPREEDRKNDLTGSIVSLKTNCLLVTPSVSRLLEPRNIPDLHTIIFVGEKLQTRDIEPWWGKVRVINAYGPSETTPASIVNASDPSVDNIETANILGKGTGQVTWIVNPYDHNRLLPIGCVGELLLEGPLVGQGYLGEPEKSAKVFINTPSWLSEMFAKDTTREGRMYKTGDLVRYNDEHGNITFIGRKDSQVKIHGQRVELGEVDHWVQEAMKDANHVVSELITKENGDLSSAELVSFLQMDGHKGEPKVFSVDTEIDNRLSEHLPTHMVPTSFISMSKMPITATGKVNRKELKQIGSAILAIPHLEGGSTDAEKQQPTSEVERQLQKIWSQVLNIDQSLIGVDDSFYRLGGDSITAMQVTASARGVGIHIRVAEILRKKTIRGLAKTYNEIATPEQVFTSLANRQKKTGNYKVELSPIQRLYFATQPDPTTCFDQYFFVKLTRKIDAKTLTKAIHHIIESNELLRARFMKNSDGIWEQHVVANVSECFHLTVQEDNATAETSSIANCRGRLDIQHGPLLAAVLFNNDLNHGQKLFFTIHHLIVDVVSWKIIFRELEQRLTGEVDAVLSPSWDWSDWTASQVQYANGQFKSVLPQPSIDTSQAIFSYWGIEPCKNLACGTTIKEFTLDKNTTSAILGSCNDAMATRPHELMISALIASFNRVFTDRMPPKVFSEGHGREAWDESIDISSTVGWFTTIFPVQTARSMGAGLTEIIRETKDSLRALPQKGWSYFTSRFFNESNAILFAKEFPLEIVVNYTGQSQEFERVNGLFEALEVPKRCDPVSAMHFRRFGLFELELRIERGFLVVSIAFHKDMSHQRKISLWIDEYAKTLKQMADDLPKQEPTWTLDNFPRAFKNYRHLDDFRHKFLVEHNIRPEAVEDVFPCSPMQEGILIAQAKDSLSYQIWFEIVFRVRGEDSRLDLPKLKRAWRTVVKRHGLLRALLVHHFPGSDRPMHVVLRDQDMEILTQDMTLDKWSRSDQSPNLASAFTKTAYPNHRLTICEHTDTSARMRIEISHAIYDGFSLGILEHDLVQAYNHEVLPPSGSYSDFIEYLDNQPRTTGTEFWSQHLAGIDPCIFPASAPSSSLECASVEPVKVEGLDGGQLHSFCSKWDVTAATVIQTAWALVLAMYTGTSVPCFGNVSSGRDVPVSDISDIFGPVVGMLPCRIDLDKPQSILDTLREVQNDYLDCVTHQHVPLASIHRAIGLGSSSSLFNTIMSLQKTQVETAQEAIVLEFGDSFDPTEYQIVVNVEDSSNELSITLSFRPGFLSSSDAAQLADGVSMAISSIIKDPLCPIREVSLVSQGDLSKIWDWNSFVPQQVERCVHEMVQDMVKATPHAPAVQSWDGTLSYSELDSFAGRLALHLVASGLRHDVIVPLCFEKSVWTPVAMLAVLKAGGAFALLDSTLPEQRLKTISRQVNTINLILSSTANLALSSRLAKNVIEVSAKAIIGTVPSEKSIQAPMVLSSPSAAMFAVFTSGSTGTPKGAVLTHANFASSLSYQAKMLGFRSNSRVFDFASYAFDIAVHNAFAAFTTGSCLCIPAEEDRRNGDISNVMSAMRVTIANLTPSVARLIKPAEVTDLKTLILAGEAVSVDDATRWRGWNVDIINAYGPAECNIVTIQSNFSDPEDVVSIGKGVGVNTWVVDRQCHNKLVPPGCLGELLLEGPLVGRGYLKEPEKTAAAFIEDPTWLLQGSCQYTGRRGRMYKTGDLVRYNADGSLAFIGRKDAQVKIRGQRVELGEVEFNIQECMREAKQIVAEIIIPRENGPKPRPVLVAFLELGDAHTSNANEFKVLPISIALEESLAQRMPQYMVPTTMFACSRLPKTPTGKIDRKRLRDAGASFTSSQLAEAQRNDRPRRQPTTEIERRLQDIWAQVLGIPASTIGLDDNFFRLGGDSIAAMKVIGEARAIGFDLAVTDIFKHSRLQAMSERLFNTKGLDNIPLCHIDGPIELSFAQERLWFLEQLHPGLNWYHMPLSLRLNGPLCPKSLEAAFLALESRHESLRTTFSVQDGVNMQHVHPFVARPLKIVDLSSTSSFEDALSQAIHKDQTTPINLGVESGLRVTLYRITPLHHVLSIVMHHIISDGWSVDIMCRELAMFYSAAKIGEDPLSSPGLEPMPIQYRDYSVWQRQPERNDEYQRQLDYWTRQLESSRPAELLCDKPRPSALSGKAAVQTFRIEGRVYEELQRYCEQQDTTLFVVLLAVLKSTLYRLTGVGDATVGAPNANRDRQELKNMIGFFVNLQCIRSRIEKDDSFQDLVNQIKDTTTCCLANQDVPFERIISKLNKDRELSRNPLVQCIFVVHSQLDLGKLNLDGIETEQISASETSRFDLEFHFFREAQGLRGEIVFSTELYYPETISNMLSVYCRVLEASFDTPHMPISLLPLMSDNDFSVLDGMGCVAIKRPEYPRDCSVVDVFRRNVNCHPDKVAVKDSSTSLTYAELDRASDLLATWLSRQPLQPEQVVGVFSSRSCQAIIAFLGILKAGLAYLPFDTKIPSGRMEDILSTIEHNRLILVGPNDTPPEITLVNTEFVYISEDLYTQIDIDQGSIASPPSATSLAYIMYTSGSTGRPKGVMIEHRGILRLVLNSNVMSYSPISPIVAHLANPAFDAATWEIFAALLNGGTLLCIDAETVLEPRRLAEIFRHEKVQAAFMTVALMKECLNHEPCPIRELDTLYVGGEKVHPADMVKAKSFVRGAVVNGYGPTENTTFSTVWAVPDDDEELYANGTPIGQALSNSGAYVMDASQQLVPLGVIGELVVTGDGLARGYTDREKNKDRFVTIKVAGHQVRAYRTGDYVRNRPKDGQTEFFGRIDGQIKLRGHRIELGEIEHLLRTHPHVNDAVALIHDCDGQEPQIASFVTMNAGSFDDDNTEDPSRGAESEQEQIWEEVFDNDMYRIFDSLSPKMIGRDFIGWTSMYTGHEINKQEMNEWLDDTIHSIYHICGQPRNVLEVGSGSGMILFNLIDGLESYVGLDPSQNAVEHIKTAAESIPELTGKVFMHKGTATDLLKLKNEHGNVSPSLAIINSVAQYFPSQKYLFQVIESILSLDSVEIIYFGDIRSYALYEEFIVTKSLYGINGDDVSKAEILQKIKDVKSAEQELLIDPVFFTHLSTQLPHLVSHVEILPKKLTAVNELSCYRYAAVIYTNKAKAAQVVHEVPESQWIDCMSNGLNEALILKLLQQATTSPIAVSNIPHDKTFLERHVVDMLDNQNIAHNNRTWLPSARQKATECASFSVISLERLAQKAGCHLEISWARQSSLRGGFDAIFHRYHHTTEKTLFRFPTDHPYRVNQLLCSQPLRRQKERELQDQLYDSLKSRLPPYMIPQSINILEKMPLNDNGKVDRRLLIEGISVAENDSHGLKRYPASDIESQIQKIWGEILNMKPSSIGLDDSFFQLGGSSITAMRLVSRVRKLGLELTVADIFRHPQLEHVAATAQSSARITAESVDPFTILGSDVDIKSMLQEIEIHYQIAASSIEDVYPCTPLQEGLLSLTSRHPGDYMNQNVLKISPDLDIKVFCRAWETLVANTGILRTRIVQDTNLGLLQVVVNDENHINWTESVDLDAYLKMERNQPMVLGQPLARYTLIRDEMGVVCWFVWTIHHALYDGWSLPRLIKSVEQLCQGQEHLPLSPEATKFQPFIKYVKDREEHAVKYWRESLANYESVPFPEVPQGVHPTRIDTIVERQLPEPKQRRLNITTSTLIRAAWALVAGHMTNTEDVVFGVTLSGRNAPVAGIDEIAGPTITTVPVRIKFSGKQTVTDFLDAAHDQSTRMIPFEQTGIHRISKLSCDHQRACAIQTLLVIQFENETNGNTDTSIMGDWVRHGQNEFFNTYALKLLVQLAAGNLTAQVHFDSRVINASLVDSLLLRLEFVIQQLDCARPGQLLRDIDILTNQDKDRIWQWNSTVPQKVDRCIHHVIQEQVQRHPKGIAISAWDGELTYGELDRLSTVLSNRLIMLGVKHNMVIPLCFEKSKWTPVAILSVLKAGGAFTLLDSSLPEGRLHTIVRQVQASILVSSVSNMALSSRLCGVTVKVGQDSLQYYESLPKISKPTDAQPPSTVAYVVCTSGSTGVPKAAMITHTNFTTGLHHQINLLGFNQTSRVFDFASYAFDVAVHNTLGTFATGGCLCIPTEKDRMDNTEQAMAAMQVTIAHITPTLARLLNPTKLPDLKTMILGGEVLPAEEARRWWGYANVINSYGPAEVTVTMTLNHNPQTPDEAASIGKGVGHVTWIVDPADHNRLLPPGCVGELLAEGPLVGGGYLNDQEKTEASFIYDPIWLTQGHTSRGYPGRSGRLYKTGDLVRYNENGSLTFVGRKDAQVKIHGQRVELGEIERWISQYLSEVTQVAAEFIKLEGNGAEKTLVAFVVVRSGKSSDSTLDDEVTLVPITTEEEELLAKNLPRYMIPTAFVEMRSLPLTPTGKINRKHLQEIGGTLTAKQLAEVRSRGKSSIRHPETPAQQTLQQIWARILNIELDLVGLDDNFFHLGGDSVAAMKIVAEARKHNLEISVADIFSYPRLHQLADQGKKISEGSGAQIIPPFSLLGGDSASILEDIASNYELELKTIEDVYPCTPLQEGLMSLTHKRSGDYTMQSVLELSLDTSKDIFCQAWEDVFQAMPVLRTRIVQHEATGLLQVVLNESIGWVDFTSLEDYIAADRHRPMSLGAPLTRYALINDHSGRCRWFVWTIHHALYDGWSLPLILNAVSQRYQGKAIERGPQFQAFIKYITQTPHDQVEEYWRQSLRGCNAIPFPTLPPRIKQPVADSVVEQLLPLPSGRLNITTSILIRAAWALVASGMTSSDDVVLGVTVFGRNAPVTSVEKMVAPAIATVPVRIQVDRKLKVSEYLNIVQKQATDMIPFEQTGLHKIARFSSECQQACSFQTLLVIQPRGLGDTDDVMGTWEYGTDQQRFFTTHAMMLEVLLTPDRILAMAKFDSKVIEPWVVEGLLKQLEYVMQQLQDAVETDTTLSNISLITQQDLHQVWEWNNEIPQPVNRCVQDLVHDQSNSRPNAQAVCSWDGNLTYAELDRHADCLAARLKVLGVRPGVFISLCFEKSMWTPVAMLAVLKAGGAFGLLDASLPEQRLQAIVSQVNPDLIISSVSNATLSSRLAKSVIQVGPDVANLPSPSSSQLLTSQSASSPMFIVFTSGSTGTPKGVILTHSNFSTGLKYQSKVMGFDNKSRVFDFASYAFDVAVHNVFATLANGGCLCIPSDIERKENPGMAMAAMEVTVADLTPTVARLLDPEALPSLKTLILVGEAVLEEDAIPFWNRCHVINGYGPAETHFATLNANAATPRQIENIGTGFGIATWIVDPEDHDLLLSVGSVGELILEGPLVGQGYLNEPNLTKKSFIEPPTWLVQGSPNHRGRRGKVYKTGDLVRYNRDGSLSYIGRKDAQVKVNGQRVELGEVEQQVQKSMAKNISVKVAVEVFTPQGVGSVPVLAAFIEGADRENTSEDAPRLLPIPMEVEDEMAEFLPRYMVPSVFISLCSLPLTPTGKTDRKRLRQIGATFSSQQLAGANKCEVSTQPNTEEERRMQKIWAKVLRIEPSSIGTNDSFFRLGGDSIAAMKVVGEARKLGFQLSVSDIFQHPRLGQAASQGKILGIGKIHDVIQHNKITGAIAQSFAQSFAQERLWFMDQLHPGLTWYLMRGAMHVHGPLQLDALNSALMALELRHEQLRTTFKVSSEGNNLQVVQPFRERALNIINVSSEEQMMKELERNQTTPFNLEVEPGWRVTVYRIHDKHHVLSIIMHHIISDGWSFNVLSKELSAFYSAAIRGQDPLSQITPLPIQYRDYSIWQHKQNESGELEDQLNYWASQLTDSQPAEFMYDKPRPSIPSGVAGVEYIRISGKLYSKLQQFCKSHDTTAFTVLLAAFRAAHFRLTGVEDATIGTAHANRDRWELQNLIGFFINIQCIRIKLQDESFETLIQHVKETITAALANQDIPFDHIVSKLLKSKPTRDSSRNPLVQVSFNVHSQQDSGGFSLEQVELEAMKPRPATRFDLEFHVFQEDQAFQGQVCYSADMYEAKTIRNLLSVFSTVLEQALDNPKTPIRALPLLTDSALSELDDLNLVGIERTDYGRDMSIVDMFRRQAAANRDKVAIKDSTGQLTYSQLDTASENIALWLARRSLAPETLVGVVAARSCQTVAAFLGILKANLAYLPLDHTSPTGRLNTILDSIPGHKIILLGPNVKSPRTERQDIEYIPIKDAVDQQIEHCKRSAQLPVLTSPSAGSLAYVMFTSGSTGKPKGVMTEHRGVVRLVCQDNGLTEHLSVTGSIAHMANIAFDVSTWEIYVALLNGGTVVCLDAMTVLDHNDLARVFARENIRNTIFTPALFKQVLAESPETIQTLHTVVLAGDKVDPQDIIKARPLFGGCIINGYGPTENTGGSAVYRISESELFTNGVPIGRSIKNSGAIVMDENLNLVPLGVIGELVVIGDGLARGYTDAKHDKNRFVDIMIKGKPVRAYRTGDYVRNRPSDGLLEYFGRMDGQVKVRGHRIELAEIEHVLRMHESVTDAAAVIQYPGDQIDKKREARIIALVTVRDEHHKTISQERIQQQLHSIAKSQLPSYMNPEAIGILDKMPINENGKIDRKSLTMMTVTQTCLYDQKSTKRQPTTEVEQKVHAIWAKVLGLEGTAIGLDDSFFELGGNSISAMRLVGESRKVGLKIAVADVFKRNTLADLAQQQHSLSNQQLQTHKEQETSNIVLIENDVKNHLIREAYSLYPGDILPGAIQDVLPVTDFQAQNLEEARRCGQYCNYFHLNLGTKLDIARLQETCATVLEKLPILRACFPKLQDRYWQVILRESRVPFISVLENTQEDFGDFFENFCRRDIKEYTPNLPPLAFVVFQHETQGFRLIIRMSHAQYDGVCFPVLIRSLLKGYDSIADISFGPDFSTFLSYSVQQRAKSTAHWRDLLLGSTLTSIQQKLRQGSCLKDPVAKSVQVETHICIASLPSGITSATLVSAAWAMLLSKITGSKDVVYGHVVNGRNSAISGIEEILGPCLNIIPVRADFSSLQTPMDLLQSIQSQYIAIGEADSFGFKDIIENCTDWPSGSTLDSVVHQQDMNMQTEIERPDTNSQLQYYKNPDMVSSTLSIVSYPCGSQMKIKLDANTHIMTREMAKQLIDGLENAVIALLSGTDLPLSTAVKRLRWIS